MVLLFTIISWSNLICLPSHYTSLRSWHKQCQLSYTDLGYANKDCYAYMHEISQSTSLSHSSAADEAWYWLKCIQCSSISACTLSERCVMLVVPAWDSGPHLSATPVEPTRLLVLAITACAVGDFVQHLLTNGSGSLFVSGVMKGNLVPWLPTHKSQETKLG